MTYRAGLASVVVGVLMAAALPAMAAVTGTGGGEKSITNTSSETHTKRVVSTSTEYLPPIIHDRGRHYTDTYSDKITRTIIGGRASRWYDRRTLTGTDVNVTFVRDRYELNYDRQVGTRDDFLRYTLAGTRGSRTTDESADLIVIGDPDYLEAAYVAQGSVDQNTHVIYDYYDDYNRVTIRQQDYDLWHDYKRHTTRYYTRSIPGSVTPLVLNMDGSGKLGASRGEWMAHEGFYTEQVALFDFFGNGQETLMEWVSPKDGLLCVPKADGSVDGTCLFGTADGFDNGYQELALRDANNDGKLTGAELDGLSVWMDANGNGIAGPSEVRPVQFFEITEIGVNHKDLKSSFKMAGQEHTMWDWQPTLYQLRQQSPGA